MTSLTLLFFFSALVSLSVYPSAESVKDTSHDLRVIKDSEEKYREEGEQRSNFYDDFETKDVVKRGISGVEDYEEIQEKENLPRFLDEDDSSVEDDTFREESERRKVETDARVKREQSKTSKRDGKAKRNEKNLANRKQRASNVIMKQGGGSKIYSETEKELDSKQAEPDLDNDSANFVYKGNQENSILENSPNLDVADSLARNYKSDANYQKRVEEEIQRRIDAIKEDIKREIEEKQRVRNIEENNAKFDELRNQDDDDDELRQQNAGKTRLVNPEALAKRRSVLRPSDSSTAPRENGQSRMRFMERKKRERNSLKNQNSSLGEKVGTKQKSVVKRVPNSSPLKKREYVRQVILVKNDQLENKKRRRKRRRSRSTRLVPRQAGLLFGKSNLVSNMDSNEKADRTSSLGERIVVSSLKEISEDPGARLASDYKEAFGALQAEPGVAVARFKRIKRVLRPSSSEN